MERVCSTRGCECATKIFAGAKGGWQTSGGCVDSPMVLATGSVRLHVATDEIVYHRRLQRRRAAPRRVPVVKLQDRFELLVAVQLTFGVG